MAPYGRYHHQRGGGSGGGRGGQQQLTSSKRKKTNEFISVESTNSDNYDDYGSRRRRLKEDKEVENDNDDDDDDFEDDDNVVVVVSTAPTTTTPAVVPSPPAPPPTTTTSPVVPPPPPPTPVPTTTSVPPPTPLPTIPPPVPVPAPTPLPTTTQPTTVPTPEPTTDPLPTFLPTVQPTDPLPTFLPTVAVVPEPTPGPTSATSMPQFEEPPTREEEEDIGPRPPEETGPGPGEETPRPDDDNDDGDGDVVVTLPPTQEIEEEEEEDNVPTASPACDCSSSSATASGGTNSKCPIELTIGIYHDSSSSSSSGGGGENQFRKYLEYHATNYQQLSGNSNNNNNVSIKIFEVEAHGSSNNVNNIVDNMNVFDAVIIPSNQLGTFVELDKLWDLTAYVAGSEGGGFGGEGGDLLQQQQQSTTTSSSASETDTTSVDWFDVLPFFRSVLATYNGGVSNVAAAAVDGSDTTSGSPSQQSSSSQDNNGSGDDSSRIRLIPLDGDSLHLFYRRDLFEQNSLAVPRTWEEYQQAAEFFHGKPWGPNGTELVGSCVSRSITAPTATQDGRCNAYWTSLVLSSMTQTKGTTSGYLLDPTTAQPILGQALDETLRILSDQASVGPIEEINGMTVAATTNETNTNYGGGCGQVNAMLNEGTCALTYNWGTQLTVDMTGYDIGVAPTPGSTHVYNRETKQLEKCTVESCPFGVHYPDIGIVNQSPYSAFGGWMGGVSNEVANSQKKAAADFLSYISNPNQSLQDVLPNERSNFVEPYRYSHTRPSSYIEAGFDPTTAAEYTDAVQAINSQNAVMDVRIVPGVDLRSILDDEVHSYLLQMQSLDSSVRRLNGDEANNLRAETIRIIDERMQESLTSVANQLPLADMYRASIGMESLSGGSANYIDPQYRSAGWGLGGFICSVSFLSMIWTNWNRRNEVMKAFQPPLLLLSATGIFLMGGTIIPLGFDDSLFSTDILDITCMVSPWIYIMGFTVFFSSVYSKVLVCLRIYNTPNENDVVCVRFSDYMRAFLPTLLVNGSVLAIWTALYPLKWLRQPVEDGAVFSDGSTETYGSCQGEHYEYFALAFFIFNLILCLVGTLQAFQCRFLVLEYNEMQWLPLSLFPFFEAWVVGGPVLFFIDENPTVRFMTLSIIISASSICGALAVFAPKDWYIRKFHKMQDEKSNIDLEQGYAHPRPASPHGGIAVLKHPTVESQKRLEKLRCQMEQVESYNTELEIDIKLLKERFRQMTDREKAYLADAMIEHDGGSQSTTNDNFISPRVGGFDPPSETTPADSEEMVGADMEHFESVWAMPDDDDMEEDDRGDFLEQRNSFSSLVAEESDAPSEVPNGGVVAAAAGGAAVAGVAMFTMACSESDDDESGQDEQFLATTYEENEGFEDDEQFSDTPRSYANDDEEDQPYEFGADPYDFQESPVRNSSSYASSVSDDDLSADEVHRLQQRIEFDDLRNLEREAAKMAEKFKLSSMNQLESIDDIQYPSNEEYTISRKKIPAAVSPARTANTTSTDDMNESASYADSAIGVTASESFDQMSNHGGGDSSSQTAGEPSGATFSTTHGQSLGGTSGRQSPDDDMKHTLPVQYMTPQKNTISHPRPASHNLESNGGGRIKPYKLNEFSAVGATGGILGEMSSDDAQSSSSDGYLDSRSSSVDALSAKRNEYDTKTTTTSFSVPINKNHRTNNTGPIQRPVGNHSSSPSATNRSSNSSQAAQQVDHLASIEAIKRKKRQLENTRPTPRPYHAREA